MSHFDHLICDDSDEVVEVVIHSAGISKPRIENDVLAAFLLYHSLAHPGAHMRLGGVDSSSTKDLFTSVQERNDYGKKSDWIEWNCENYMALLERNNDAFEGFKGWSADVAGS